MASKLLLSRPAFDMNWIWNVSQNVGDDISCPNQPTDVELVKILIAETMRPGPPQWVHPSLRVPFVLNGQMDITLAYWIRVFTHSQRSLRSTAPAGIISPARGASSGSYNDTIFKLNGLLIGVAPGVWANISSRLSASPQLRSELQ
jgi:urea transporter